MPTTHQVPARFVTGSLLRHVTVMAGTGAVGLIAVFAVDLLNLFYISRLGQPAMAAAVGFAGAIGFFQISLALGMVIGIAAVVSRAIGAGAEADARGLAATSMAAMVVIMGFVGVATVAALGPILDALGAVGETRRLAYGFLLITSPSLVLMAAGMCLSAFLRSAGNARRAMNVTLVSAFVTATVDPLLIFGLNLGLEGAAISTVVSRASMVALGWINVRQLNLIGRIDPARAAKDLRRIAVVAGPAILTNLATPVGAAYVTRAMARFGSDAMAGQATVDRLSPVAFGLVYALSGAVGPILAQNLGAGRLDRVRDTLRESLLFVVAAVLAAWAALALAQDWVVSAFSASGDAAVLVKLFCSLLAGSFLFTGSLFVANAAFNNLGFPVMATLFNWGRATLGTIPFVAVGSAYGAQGVLIGAASGSLVFGIGAVIVAFVLVRRMDRRDAGPRGVHVPAPIAGTGGAAFAAFASRPRDH